MKNNLFLSFIFLWLCSFTYAQGDNPPGVTLYSSSTSCNYTSGTVSNATPYFNNQATCDNYSGNAQLNDVFYNFTATETQHFISVDPIGSNSDLDVVIQILYYSNGTYYENTCSDFSGGGGETTVANAEGLTIGQTYYVRIYDYGNTSPSYPNFQICVIHTAGGTPDLAYSSHTIDDDTSGGSDGNDNGLVNPGESIELDVTIENIGDLDATNVEAILSTNDSDITITDDDQFYGTIASGGTEDSPDFDFDVSANCPDKDVTFTLDITSDEGNWTEYFTIHVYAPNCNYSLNPNSDSYTDQGGSGSISVNTTSGCSWNSSVNSGSSWISINSGFSGTGSGNINYSVSNNSSTNSRTGSISVEGEVHSIFQTGMSPCNYSLNPGSDSYTNQGGSGSISVNTTSGCSWNSSVNSGSSWISINSGFSGTGSGNISYTVSNNSSTNSRTGSISVEGEIHSIFQAGMSPCNYSLNPTSITIDGLTSNYSFDVNTISSCNWTASITQGGGWLSIIGSGNGAGNGTVNYSVSENNTGSIRYGTISVGGTQYQIQQSDLPSIPGINLNAPSGGETFYIGGNMYYIFELSGGASNYEVEFSSDNGNTWNLLDYSLSAPDGLYQLGVTSPNVNSTACRIKVIAYYFPNFQLEEISNPFTITYPNTSAGIGFNLNSNLSHLYWPYENSTWENRNGWHGGAGGPDRPNDGILGGSGFGEGGHDLGEYYADDWNNATSDCNENFKAPITGTVIYAESSCSPTCAGTCLSMCCGNGFGNAVTIKSNEKPYAFKVSHLNSVNVSVGQFVNHGDIIGTLGSTGRSSGPHAHCTLYKNIFDDYDAWQTCEERISMGLSCGIDNSAPYAANQFACEFMFDAVDNGTGGGEPEFELLLSGNPNLCAGGTVTISPSITGASYYWNTGETTASITVSEAGIYAVIVTDNAGNTFYSEIAAVTVDALPNADIWVLPESQYCMGDTVWLSAFDMSNMNDGSLESEGMDILWSNGMTDMIIPVTSSDMYTVTVQNPAGCQETSSQVDVSFFETAIPVVQVNDNLLASSVANEYQWFLNGIEIPSATAQFHEVTETGYYTVVTTDANGCNSTSEAIYVNITSIENIEADYSLLVFPNPTNTNFSLVNREVMEFIDECVMLDVSGKEIYQWTKTDIESNIFHLPSNIKNGIYILQFSGKDHQLYAKLIVGQ